MGASNALRVYAGWGGLLAKNDRPFRVLVYMALVSRDNDSEPWCSVGHESLAIHALALDVPELGEAGRDDVLRKVRRALTTLHGKHAVETERKATFGRLGPVPARYRLYLDGPPGRGDVIPMPVAPPPPGPELVDDPDAGPAGRGAARARRLLLRDAGA